MKFPSQEGQEGQEEQEGQEAGYTARCEDVTLVVANTAHTYPSP